MRRDVRMLHFPPRSIRFRGRWTEKFARTALAPPRDLPRTPIERSNAFPYNDHVKYIGEAVRILPVVLRVKPFGVASFHPRR